MRVFKFLEFLIEARDVQIEKKRSLGNQIVNFLKKNGFEYGGPGRDSNIFLSFKVNKFTSIIPPIKVGGVLYQSPHGVYCFDMNGFKEKLFGEGEISPENFNEFNIQKLTNDIDDLGFGFDNVDRNKVKSSAPTQTAGLLGGVRNVPRYLYIFKMKDGANIYSKMTNENKYYDPIKNLLVNYSHYFLKDNRENKFSIKNKKENLEIKKLAPKDWMNYFQKTKEKWNDEFIERLTSVLESLIGGKDQDRLHIKFYSFILGISKLFDNHFVVFTLICNAIGVCGFTQRGGEGGFIHSAPDFQTVIVNTRCVEDYIIIDLGDRSVDRLIRMRGVDKWNEFVDSLKEEDVVKDKKSGLLYRKQQLEKVSTSTLKDVREDSKKGLDSSWSLPSVEDYEKISLEGNKVYNLVERFKPGDYLKITYSHRKKDSLTVCWEFEEITTNGSMKDIKSKIFVSKGDVSKKSLDISNLNYTENFPSFKIYDDLRLYNILNLAIKGRKPNEFVDYDVTIQIYRGDLDKPIKEINSKFGLE